MLRRRYRIVGEVVAPEGFQRAEYLLDNGMLDMIVERKLMKETISKLLSMLNPRCR